MAYYVLKPVREALVLGEGSAELKSYLSAGQVVLLAFVVPFYGRLVSRLPRMKLINTVTLFFTACPVIFYGLAKAGVPLAVIFFIWIGIFSLMIIAQFWSFATDVYTKEEGERLFPDRRVRRLARRGVRRPDRRSAHRADRRLRADAGGRRHPARAAGADQLHQRAPCAPRRRQPAAATSTPAAAAEADGRQRLRAGVPDALPAPDGADADDAQLGEQHRRVHPRPHRDRRRPAHGRRRAARRGSRTDRSSATSTRSTSRWSTASDCCCSCSSCRASSSGSGSRSPS